MVVQHNMQAMNSSRMLNITTGQQAKSTEKLSSGYKINRAADDAAGLSISEKMRKQIRGLDRASTNAEDGVSAVQTAEGALTEVHDMLQRMNELAVQAANGTNSITDRKSIQDEIDQLTTEIDRVAETTKFNETYLLKGDVNGATKTAYLAPKDAGLKGTMGEVTSGTTEVTFTLDEVNEGDKVMIGGKEYEIQADSYTEEFEAEPNKIKASTAYTYMGNELAKANAIGTVDADGKVMQGATSAGIEMSGAKGNVATISLAQVTVAQPLSFNLHVGADADMTNKIGVSIEKMDTATLGIKGLDVVGKEDEKYTDISSGLSATAAGNDITDSDDQSASDAINASAGGTAATYAIDSIANAIQKVSDQRSALGAVQNRLEHTIKNLDNVVENTTAAESRIRDTDMADEMVKYSKNNILAQAGQSMLAQANQSTQGVLSILG